MKKIQFLILLVSLFTSSSAQFGTNDITFNNLDNGIFGDGTSCNGTIYTTSIQPNSKIIVGGDFTAYNGKTTNFIARLNSNGSLDTSFNTGSGFDTRVNTTIIQPDGKVIVGGLFRTYNGHSVNYIIRLNSDGSIDTSFSNNIGSGFNNSLHALAIQTDGKIIAAGNFTSFKGTPQKYILRLNDDGSLDTSFKIGIGPNNTVNCISVQNDGKLIFGGNFVSFNSKSFNRIVRLNSNGTIDTTFNIQNGFNNTVNIIAQQSNGKVIVGGNFTAYKGITRSYLVRIDPNGDLDISFKGSFDGPITSIAFQSNKIIVGGGFVNSNGISKKYLARTDANGNLDITFNTDNQVINNYILTTSILSDDKIIICTSINGRKSILRLNTNGSIDSLFNPQYGFDNYLRCIRIQRDNKIIIGGCFKTYNGINRNCIIRLSNDGNIDKSFDPGLGFTINDGRWATVNAIAIQNDGKILVGGDFNLYNGIPTNCIIRLNQDGSKDASFNIGNGFAGSGINTSVNSIAIQKNGKIIVVGNFKSYNNYSRNNIVCINSDGTIDPLFNTDQAFNYSAVNTVAIQDDDKIIIGANTTTMEGYPTNGIIRLNKNGSTDYSFDVGIGFSGGSQYSTITSIAIQPDSKIIVGGEFTFFKNIYASRIVRLNQDGSYDSSFVTGSGFNNFTYDIKVQSNGRIIVCGGFAKFNNLTSKGIACLNADGSYYNNFYIGTGFDEKKANSYVSTIAIQLDNKIIVGGEFNFFNSTQRNRIARLNNSTPSNIIDYSIDSSKDIKISPNPSNSGLFSFEIDFDKQPYTVSNIKGEVIRYGLTNTPITHFDLSQENDGIYFIKVQNTETFKVIINRN